MLMIANLVMRSLGHKGRTNERRRQKGANEGKKKEKIMILMVVDPILYCTHSDIYHVTTC